jgi:hypothetical protein
MTCGLQTFRPVVRRLRSRAPLSLATVIALSNSATAPRICRTILAAGVSSTKDDEAIRCDE